MKRYFIVGTDTNCGKTYVTCQLLDALKDKKVMAIKPVATGCYQEKGQLVGEDEVLLKNHSGDQKRDIGLMRYQMPVSPHIAAKAEGESISLQTIADFCNQESFKQLDYLLIEGAGGLMAPLNEAETWLHFLRFSKIPVILVVGLRLGCLNHALLTAEVLKTHDIPCVGWVANCIDKEMLALSENIETLKKMLWFPCLATIPFGGSADIYTGDNFRDVA